jgi:hypothetical protein
MEKKRKKSELDKEIDDLYEIDEESDYPVHEKLVKQKKIRTMK